MKQGSMQDLQPARPSILADLPTSAMPAPSLHGQGLQAAPELPPAQPQQPYGRYALTWSLCLVSA